MLWGSVDRGRVGGDGVRPPSRVGVGVGGRKKDKEQGGVVETGTDRETDFREEDLKYFGVRVEPEVQWGRRSGRIGVGDFAGTGERG